MNDELTYGAISMRNHERRRLLLRSRGGKLLYEPPRTLSEATERTAAWLAYQESADTAPAPAEVDYLLWLIERTHNAETPQPLYERIL